MQDSRWVRPAAGKVRWLPGVVVGFATLLGGCASNDEDDSGIELTYTQMAPVIQKKCVRCHSDPPQNRAPFALDTYERVFEHRTEVERALVSEAMPPVGTSLSPPVENLTRSERENLIAWLRVGAPE